MKLFTKEIDTKLFQQYPKGNDLANQVVVAKIFNPYGRGRWFLVNADPNDPNYIWAIVELDGDVEVGSIHRQDLEAARITRFNFPLERDLGFRQQNAKEVLEGLRKGSFFKKGGTIEQSNNEMLVSQVKAIKHHADEISKIINGSTKVEAWVVGKVERAATDLSDITHYLDGTKFEGGGYMESGGLLNLTQVVGKARNNNIDDTYLFSSNSKGLDFLTNHKNIEVLSIGNGKYDLFYGWDDDKQSDGVLYFGKWNKGNFGFTYRGNIKYAKGGYMESGGSVDMDRLQMDLQAIKKKYPNAKVSYTFAKDSSGKGYVITAKENNQIVYTSYKMEHGGMMENGGSIFQSLKEKTKSGIGRAKDFTKKQIHDQKKKVALSVIDETKDKFKGAKQKMHLRAAEELVRNNYGMGGKVHFKDKVKAISERLLQQKKVDPKYKSEYGKTYNKKESIEAANRIAGAMAKKEKLN